MPLEINITDADIEYAEKVLLPEGKAFDEERRLFIRDLSQCQWFTCSSNSTIS